MVDIRATPVAFDLNPAEIACFGDSRVYNGYLLGTNGSEGYSRYMATAGFQTWLQNLGRGRWWFPNDLQFGVAGDTTTLMLARLSPVVASRAKAVILWGGTNDASGFTVLANLTVTKNNMLSMLDQLTKAGKRVILVAESPRGNSTFTTYRLTGNPLKFWMEYRRFMLEVCSRIPGVVVIDIWGQTVIYNSTQGELLVALSPDGLHPNIAFHKDYLAPALYTVLNAWFPVQSSFWPTSNSDPYDAINNPKGNWVTNGMLDGTGGTGGAWMSGTVPASWTTFANGTWTGGGSLAIVGAQIAGTNAVQHQFTFSGTAPAGTPTFDLRQNLAFASFAAGDKFRAYAICEIDAGFTNLKEATLLLTYGSSGNFYDVKGMHTATGDVIPVGTYTGATAIYHMTPELQIMALTPTSASVRMVHTPVASVALSAVVRWSRVAVRKIVNEGF